MKLSKEQQSVIAIIAGLLFFAWLKHNYILLIAGGVVAIALPFPSISKPIHEAWMYLSKKLGWVSSHIILFILFYFVLTPISLLRRLFGKQDMITSRKKENTTFYIRNHTYTSGDFLNPW